MARARALEHHGHGQRYALGAPEQALPRLHQLLPSAAIVVAHDYAVRSLGTPAQGESVAALQAAWRAQLQGAVVSRRLDTLYGERPDSPIFAGVHTPARDGATLLCACSDVEEAAGLCLRALVAEALCATGRTVVLDGMVQPPIHFQAELAMPQRGSPFRAEQSCGHRHKSYGTALDCGDRLDGWAGSWRRTVGAELRIVRLDDGVAWYREVVPERLPYREEVGQTWDGLRWTERVWNTPQERPGHGPFRREATFERNELSMNPSWPIDPKGRYGPADHIGLVRGMAQGISLLLGMTEERLLRLHRAYHATPEGQAEVVTLAPAERPWTGGDGEGRIFRFPGVRQGPPRQEDPTP